MLWDRRFPLLATLTYRCGITNYGLLDSTHRGDEQEFAGVHWFRYSDVPLHRSDPHLKHDF